MRNLFRLRSVATETNLEEASSVSENPSGFKVHIFGSSYEGTCTAGMRSDIDYVYVAENIPVTITGLIPLRSMSLIVIEKGCSPGYAKLQLAEEGEPVFGASEKESGNSKFILPIHVDRDKRSVVSLHKDFALNFANWERCGPAFSCPNPPHKHLAPMDFVLAFCCKDYPKCAADYFSRDRKYGWPPVSALQACQNMGCIFVAKGHPNSAEQHLEWRISMSRQERLLVSLFNSVQLKCLILLKMIKKNVINHFIKEKTLTSYHCKTCMLFLVEHTAKEIWTPENLLACLDASLRQLLICTERYCCPNYFIPSENMFEGINRTLLVKLRFVLKKLISSNSSYLLHIKCDDLNQRLRNALFGNQILAIHGPDWKVKDDFHLELHCHVMVTALNFRRMIINNCYDPDPEIFLQRLLNKMALYRKNEISKDAGNEKQTFLSLVLPYIELCLISNIVAYATEDQKSSTAVIWQYVTNPIWSSLSNKYDNVTFKLKHACFMYKLGYYEASLDILTNNENRLGFMHSICSCDEVPVVPDRLTRELDVSKSDSGFLNDCLAPCVIFLPSEEKLTPWALQCEWHRLREESLEDEELEKYCWYNWSVVDAKFLLYFLFFINHFRMGMYDYAKLDADDMAHLLSNWDISHKETALNLLTWVTIYFGNSTDTAKFLKESLLLKPKYNAAKLLMGDCWIDGRKKPLYEFAANVNHIWQLQDK